jgi:ferritin-like metal-binding protein YciE
MSELNSLKDLLVEELKDLYSAENQLLKALPRMAKAASDETLKAAFEEHLEQTREHAKRLEKIMERLDESPRGKKCAAMEGLIEEAKQILEEDGEDSVIDSALIGAAQKVEHYEIASYGTARCLAERIGESKIAQILQMTLDEEGETDKKLTEIASTLELVPVEAE